LSNLTVLAELAASFATLTVPDRHPRDRLSAAAPLSKPRQE
jgi:hypothetical protein